MPVRLDTEFIRLPLDFDAERLRAEVLEVPEDSWRPHPQGNPGNWALPLLAVDGDPLNDATRGAMAPTPHLRHLEYLQQVLASFETVIGRARLMRLDGNTEATLHVDTNYYWAERVRIHVPILTSESISFHCADRSLHMPAGQSWIFDTWRPHNVLNNTGDRRIHLVADTVGSAHFWDLVARGRRPFDPDGQGDHFDPRLVEHVPGLVPDLAVERHNFPRLMTPWEVEQHVEHLVLKGLDTQHPTAAALGEECRRFVHQWRSLWAETDDHDGPATHFEALRDGLARNLAQLAGRLRLDNGTDPVVVARQVLIEPAIGPRTERSRRDETAAETSRGPRRDDTTTAPSSQSAAPEPQAARQPMDGAARRRRGRRRPFERPIFIVAPPRSGTTLLFETLALSPSVWTIGDESHAAIESVEALHPSSRGWDSNRLGLQDAKPQVIAQLEANFLRGLRDRDGQSPEPGATGLRLLEKTPKNSLRVPFLHAAYPDARFVFVQRDPAESLSSMIAAWESRRFVTYPDLPEWAGPPWSLLLVPEWRKLAGAQLPEVVAEQWRMASEILLTDLEHLPQTQWAVVGYHQFLADPQAETERLCQFLDIEWDRQLDDKLPLSRYTLTPPAPDKWRQHADLLERVLPATADAARRGRAALTSPITLRPRLDDAAPAPTSPYRSVNTANMPDLLESLGTSILASTYQTGKLVAVRAMEGKLNTHFRPLESPMGIAYRKGRLAVGTRTQVLDYQNLPQLTERLSPPGRHDACFVPRSAAYTGDIRIHDVAWAGDELWVVATRFSCLATLDGEHSFVPRWRPSFISALAPEDRCHLNGLAVRDDRITHVTALGTTDTAGGWRADKAHGGVIIDVESNEIAVSGLSMPHSPRWHDGRLWVLESGEGSLAAVDLASGTVETVAQLPGFTRGLAFAGPLAFIGLSEVREANTFGGLPLTARLEDRQCGIWVVNVETGSTVGFIRFEDLVEEIFDVALLPGIRFPEVAEHGSDAVNNAFVIPPQPEPATH